MPTILCIDDRTESLKVRQLMLETQGYSVLIADNGPSGLQLLSENTVDAVVLDYRMKGMDGLAVATAIRERYGNLPIVLLSGYPADIPKRLLEMVNAFIPKGPTPQVLLEELRRITGGAKRSPKSDITPRTANYPKRKKAPHE